MKRVHTSLAFFLSLSLIKKTSRSGGIVKGFFIGFSSSSGNSARNRQRCRKCKAECQDLVQKDTAVLDRSSTSPDLRQCKPLAGDS